MLCPLLYSAGWGQALSDYPLLQCRCRSRARASLRNRLPGFFVFLPLLLFQAGALVILRNVKNTGFQCPRFRSSCLLLAQSGHPLVALHMSAFGGKADMTVCGNPLSRSLLGVKRTWACALGGQNERTIEKLVETPWWLCHPFMSRSATIWRASCSMSLARNAASNSSNGNDVGSAAWSK